jgi:hypothetical protein
MSNRGNISRKKINKRRKIKKTKKIKKHGRRIKTLQKKNVIRTKQVYRGGAWNDPPDKIWFLASEVDALLSKQEQGEPVAWRFQTGTFWNREVHWRYVLSLEGTEGLQGLEPLYTTPQQRTWVGLTDKDKNQIAERLGLADVAWLDLMQAIEAKLKEKNG